MESQSTQIFIVPRDWVILFFNLVFFFKYILVLRKLYCDFFPPIKEQRCNIVPIRSCRSSATAGCFLGKRQHSLRMLQPVRAAIDHPAHVDILFFLFIPRESSAAQDSDVVVRSLQPENQ